MNRLSEDFQKRLLATFNAEAREHLQTIASGLVTMERTPGAEQQSAVVETVFREVHSLKGAARAVNLTSIEAVCQAAESVLAALKRQEIAASPALLDVLHQSVNTISALLSAGETGQTVPSRVQINALIERLEQLVKAPHPPQTEPPGARAVEPPPERAPGDLQRSLFAGTVRVSTAKLDAVFRQTEELLSTKLTASQRATELRDIQTALAAWHREWATVRSDVRSARHILETGNGQNGSGRAASQMGKFLAFLDWNYTFVSSCEHRLAALVRSMDHDERMFGGAIARLLEDTKELMMMPFSSLLDLFPGFVRELSRDQGKEAALVVQGGDIQVDRRVLEEIKDPLMHLVRNSIDHGIESPEERERKKKPRVGAITIAISHRDANKVELRIADDGKGVDIAKTRTTAARLGMLTGEEAERLDEQEALTLIFHSGVSTSPVITDVSGRGLGLAIVRDKAAKLSGSVSVETRPGAGTTFRMVIPLTLATFRGIIVQASEHRFVLPSTAVERVFRTPVADIRSVENRDTVLLDGQAVALIRLADVLELPRSHAAPDAEKNLLAVVLATPERRIAFQVDDVLDEQEVLVKNLGPQLVHVRNIAGATIVGTGQVLLILNISDLMESAVRVSETIARPLAAPSERQTPAQKTVLVVEDSITARTLLKNVLEAAGYDVETAVDGVDGFTRLRERPFDLVVSDVDMPRMSGFDLTAKIRGDRTLTNLPVVLVTALDSREHRERGIESGADAYIVKSSFDQSNLLDVIRRLI